MKKTILFLLLLVPLFSTAQIYDPWERKMKRPINQVSEKIRNGVEWEALLQFVEEDSILNSKDFSSDITSTIQLLANVKNTENLIDAFMYSICKEKNDRFSYNKSGHLTNAYRVYTASNINFEYNEVHGEKIDMKAYGRANFRLSKILKSKKEEIIPRLIHYLSNDSATKQILDGWDYDDPSHYLSVSDIAMELLEVYTLCDFFETTNTGYGSCFSNKPIELKEKITSDVNKWWSATKDLDRIDATNFFLDSICDPGWSYQLTCHNILSYGDTTLATKRYRQHYENNRKPYSKEIKTGRILYTLGDEVLMNDCLHDINDFRYSISKAADCVRFILENSKYEIGHEAIAEVVATEVHSIYRKKQGQYLWHSIFDYMGETETKWSNPILIELLKIKEPVKSSKIHSSNWRKPYPEQYENNYRVCDFALLKYFELNPDLAKELNWNKIKSIDAVIDDIISKQ